MRLNDSKNKRIMIMEQISMRERSREKERKSSLERRRKIEQNLNDFMKTMSNVSFRHTGNSSGFRYEHPYSQIQGSQQDLQKPKQSEKSSLKQEYDEVLRSPSFKDINLGMSDGSKMELSSESIKLSHFGNTKEQLKQGQREENEVQQEEIAFTKRNDQKKQIQQQLTPNSILQNESSASAIFFTSQFNEFISKNHISSKQQIQGLKDTQMHEKQQLVHRNSNKNLNESDFKPQDPAQNTQSSNKRPSQQLQPLKFNHIKQPLISDHIAQNNHQINPVPQTLTDQDRKSTLIKNKSGHSLAFSNQSSLKYSLNESNIKQILNRKFTNELIADNHQFDPSNQDSSLYHHLKLQIVSEKYQNAHRKMALKQLTLFVKTVLLSRKVQKRQKRMYFQAFIINQELNFQEKVSEIKCDKFLQQKQEQRLKNIFESIKFSFLTLPRSKIEKALQMEQKRQREMKQKIFRCLKIAWYDQKVKKQIELYYLSKLFTHFTRVIKVQKQLMRNKCLAFYCSNLKKRMFKYLKQGVDKLQQQRIQRDNATWHYSFGLQRKVFEAWKDRLAYKDRYISLAMTTKNTFKQTKDQKWLQIKTVDFKQIKYQ